ncbi:kinase [Sandarakinorhabdus oryzae]|uniref:kinase n=1 Tax=Sandarakinorhabdus oryzae TaxID=2675220 RepID=UPI001F2198DF|nr:kinase [Sandarakinorhabdus oryzae]
MDALPLLLDWLAPRLATRPLIIGIAGPQGSGKSTLAAGLAARLAGCATPVAGGGRIVAAVSIDDFYLSRRQRQALARSVHPLLATRGPPGTHDLPLLLDVLRRVRAGQPVNLPVFDKLADDRLPPQHWRRFDRIDILLLEGWCVGARPQPVALLAEPVNALEAREDAGTRWRTHVNQALAGPYSRAWAQLDALAFLAAPDWETVPRWRAEQEAAMVRATGKRGMPPAAIARFCAHYERLTRWQLATTPARAGLVLQLDGQRHVIGQARR